MIGVLCSESDLQAFSNRLRYFIELNPSNKNESMIAFTVSDIDFTKRSVRGYFITKYNMEMIETPVPPIIFNFVYQPKRADKKKARILAEHTNVINGVNQFSQDMIMEILLSSPQTKSMLLKLDTPDLLLNQNSPVMITPYLQRGINGQWNVLPGMGFPKELPKERYVHNKLTETINAIAIDIASYISCFIPGLAFCSTSFVLNQNLNPFFIELQGWNPKMLLTKESHDFQYSFINHLLEYYKFLQRKKNGGIDFVD